MLCWDTGFAAERAIKRQTLSSPAPVETPYLSGKYRALVIGNNDYDDPEKLWPSLKTAVADAKANPVNNYEENTKNTFAADPVIPYMKPDQLKKAIIKARKSMEKAVKELDFIDAAGYRDEIKMLEERLKEIS